MCRWKSPVNSIVILWHACGEGTLRPITRRSPSNSQICMLCKTLVGIRHQEAIYDACYLFLTTWHWWWGCCLQGRTGQWPWSGKTTEKRRKKWSFVSTRILNSNSRQVHTTPWYAYDSITLITFEVTTCVEWGECPISPPPPPCL